MSGAITSASSSGVVKIVRAQSWRVPATRNWQRYGGYAGLSRSPTRPELLDTSWAGVIVGLPDPQSTASATGASMSRSPSSARWSSTPAVIILLDEATSEIRSAGELAPVVLVHHAVVAVHHDQAGTVQAVLVDEGLDDRRDGGEVVRARHRGGRRRRGRGSRRRGRRRRVAGVGVVGAAVDGVAVVAGVAVTVASGGEPALDGLSEPEQAAVASTAPATSTATTEGALRMPEG